MTYIFFTFFFFNPHPFFTITCSSFPLLPLLTYIPHSSLYIQSPLHCSAPCEISPNWLHPSPVIDKRISFCPFRWKDLPLLSISNHHTKLYIINIFPSSSSPCFFSGLPQMPPPLEPLVLQEPPVQMEPLVADLQPHPTPPATAGYNRHRPKSRRWAEPGQTKIRVQSLVLHAILQYWSSWGISPVASSWYIWPYFIYTVLTLGLRFSGKV